MFIRLDIIPKIDSNTYGLDDSVELFVFSICAM
jgi:hypothetical protein